MDRDPREPSGTTRGTVRPPRGRRVAFALLAGAIAVAAIELLGAAALRFGLDAAERAALDAALGLGPRGANPVERYVANPYLGYVSNPAFTFEGGARPHHPIGIRDPGFEPTRDPGEAYRVVALGGSTTYGMYFETAGSVWPHLVGTGLAKTLGRPVEVVNAGVPNYSTWETVGMAAFWLPEFSPDLVVIHTGLNDAFTVGYPDEGGPDGRTFRHAWSHRPIAPAVRAVLRASRFARFVAASVGATDGRGSGDMSEAIQYPPASAQQVATEGSRATGKYFRRNLETLVALARHTGAHVVLVDMPFNPDYERGYGPYYDAVARAVARNNAIVHDVGAALEIPVVPLYDAMRDPALFLDAAHVGQPGMLRKAQGVYDAVLPLVR